MRHAGKRKIRSAALFVLCGLLVVSPQLAGAEVLRSAELAAEIEAWLNGQGEERESGPSPETVAQDASGGGGSYWKEHFTLHGYLTTAWVDHSQDPNAPFPNSDNSVLGLTNEDTFDYRNAALQLRYEVSPRHSFLIQASHRKYGDSPVTEDEDAVELDWLFYQLNITDNTRLKIGRFPVAAGIYNEIRDVGILLPFFRPPFTFYREGSFFSETVDGIGLGHSFGAASDWRIDADVYYGEYELLESGSANTGVVFEADATGAVGFQLWLNTPVSGLRVGAGGQQYDVSEESGFNNVEETWETWFFSIDGSFEKWLIRAEYREVDFPVDNSSSPGGEANVSLSYVQLGYHVTEKLSIYGQQEFGNLEQSSLIFRRPLDVNLGEDTAVSVAYAFLPNVVLKGEYHEQEYEAAVGVDFFPGPPFQVQPIFGTFEDDYTIVSLSLSF